MYYTYVLKSRTNGDVYVGSTDDLKNRYASHNSGKVKSTKPYRPWTLVYYEAYKDKRDATKREKELKQHRAKEFLEEHIINSLNI